MSGASRGRLTKGKELVDILAEQIGLDIDQVAHGTLV